jgi:hypothetical protein
MRVERRKGEWAILAVAMIAMGVLAGAVPEGSSRLVSIEYLPAEMGIACAWDQPAGNPNLAPRIQQQDLISGLPLRGVAPSLMASLLPGSLFSAIQQGRAAPPRAINEVNRAPVFRTLADTYPVYTAVGVNLQTDEVFLQDNNLWSTRVFKRLDNTPKGATLTEEKRVIQGQQTYIQFNNGLYIDPANGDVYSVESDTGDKMVVFTRDAAGNIAPKRILHTPHRVYSIAVDEEKNELYVSVEYPPAVVVYRKEAEGDEKPIRRLEGDRTKLAAPHGVAVDVKNGLLFVNNWGQTVSLKVPGNNGETVTEPGSGRFDPPSINIYALSASGDTAPLRVIQGDKTQLDWPGNMTLNPDTGELYIANDVGQSILVFNGLTSAKGNVPPARVLKGNKTALNYPTGVFADAKHQELWVSNLGNSSATVYPLMANGNVAPLRTIRSAPEGHVSLTFGRTAGVTYDSNRQEILVPN